MGNKKAVERPLFCCPVTAEKRCLAISSQLAKLARRRGLCRQHGKLGFNDSDLVLVGRVAQCFLSAPASLVGLGFVKNGGAYGGIRPHGPDAPMQSEDRRVGNE